MLRPAFVPEPDPEMPKTSLKEQQAAGIKEVLFVALLAAVYNYVLFAYGLGEGGVGVL